MPMPHGKAIPPCSHSLMMTGEFFVFAWIKTPRARLFPKTRGKHELHPWILILLNKGQNDLRLFVDSHPTNQANEQLLAVDIGFESRLAQQIR